MRARRNVVAREVRYRPRWIGVALAASLLGFYLGTYSIVRRTGCLGRTRAGLVLGAEAPASVADVRWSFRVEAARPGACPWLRVPYYPLARGEEALCERMESFALADKRVTLAHLRASRSELGGR